MIDQTKNSHYVITANYLVPTYPGSNLMQSRRISFKSLHGSGVVRVRNKAQKLAKADPDFWDFEDYWISQRTVSLKEMRETK